MLVHDLASAVEAIEIGLAEAGRFHGLSWVIADLPSLRRPRHLERHRAPAHLWRPMALYGVLREVPQPLPALAEPVSFGGDGQSLLCSLERPAGKALLQPGVENLRGWPGSFCQFPDEKLVDAGRSFNGAESVSRENGPLVRCVGRFWLVSG